MKRKLLIMAGILAAAAAVFWSSEDAQYPEPVDIPPVESGLRTICDTVEKGETLLKIFSKHDLHMNEFIPVRNATLEIFPVRKLQIGQPYRFELDGEGKVSSFRYWINDDSILDIRRGKEGFCGSKESIPYEKHILVLEGTIEDTLISSIGDEGEHLSLAMDLSDIYAWDIDFTSDLQKGDTWRVAAEGMYLDGKFRKFGNILAAEFRNRGKVFRAYRYENKEGKSGYYDEEGNSLKKMFLKAPLSFRRISSYYSSRRFHPILKIRRPHRGIDYAAPKGTPVSAVGDGSVLFAGRRGQYGNLVIIGHPNNWKTCYGHLSGISRLVRRGKQVVQGQVIGSVGSTGLATGPHLHFEVRRGGKSIDPLSAAFPRGGAIPKSRIRNFCLFRDRMDRTLASGSAGAATAALRKENNGFGARL